MPKRVSLADAIPLTAPVPPDAAETGSPPLSGPRARPVLPVDIASIRVPDERLRNVDPDAAARIADSIARIGLQSPVLLCPDRDDPTLHMLVAGAHRLEAVRMLGWSSIDALVVDAGLDEIDLIEIDENLIREDLTALDRARFLDRRKRIFARIREPGRGGDRKSADYAPDPVPGLSWADDTAERVGLSKRAVQRAAAIGANIAPDLADALAATPIARREGDLFRLSQMPSAEREEVLRLLQTAEKPPSTLSELLGRPASDPPPDPLERLKRNWNETPPEARAEFVSWLRGGGWLSEHGPTITERPENGG